MSRVVATERRAHGRLSDVSTDSARRTKPFDFRTPGKLGKDQVRRLELTHEAFARVLGNELSNALRTLVRLELMSIDQISYDEYVRSMPNPSVIAPMTLAPLPSLALVEMSTQTGLTLVDRLLGGIGKPGRMRRPTDLEIDLLQEITAHALEALEQTFEPIVRVEPAAHALEFNPHFIQAANPSEMVVVMSYSLAIIEGHRSEGLVTLCYPFALLAPLFAEDEDDEPELQPALPVGDLRDSLLHASLPGVTVPLSVCLNTSRVATSDLTSLQVGDVLKLDHRVDEDVRGIVAGRDVLEGRIGRKGKHLAIQISRWRTS